LTDALGIHFRYALSFTAFCVGVKGKRRSILSLCMEAQLRAIGGGLREKWLGDV
jgi:hypothetical protein